MMNERHPGPSRPSAGAARWLGRGAAAVLVLVAVPPAAIAVLAWLFFAATPRQMWAATGLIFLACERSR